MKRIIIGICLMIIPLSSVYAETYNMAVGPAPGFIENGKGPGDILLDAFVKHLRQKEIAVTLEFMPWKRADTMFNTGRVDLEFPALLGDTALKHAIFSAPVSKVGMVIFNRTDQPPIASVDAVKGMVGVVRGFTYPEAMSQNPNIKLQVADEIDSVMLMLSRGRLDAVIHWGAASKAAQKKLGLENVHAGKEFTLSFGCFAAHMTPKGAKAVNEINQILGEMIVNGEYQEIMKGTYRSLIP